MSKSSKSPTNAIGPPPKAALAASSATKDEVHRRRNPFNDMLRHRTLDAGDNGRGAASHASASEPRLEDEPPVPNEEEEVTQADRFAELEKALQIAKEEQSALRAELQKTRHVQETDRDTAKDMHYQTSETHQDGRRPPSRDMPMRQSFERNEEDIIRQNFSLRYRIAQLQEQLAATEAMYRDHLPPETSHGEAELNEMRSRLHASEKESQSRLQQLLSLKSSISSLTRVDTQTTDSELTESFSQLANRIREWVITNFRRSKWDIATLPPETVEVLQTIVASYERVGGADRLALYQAIVSNTLMEVLQEPVIVGLPKTGALSAVRSFAESIQDAGADYRGWRRATIRALDHSETKRVIEQERDALIHRLAGEIGHLLFTLTSVSLAASAQSALIGIIKSAVDLQRTLALQKARYQLLFFHNQKASASNFEDLRMESVNDLDCTIDEDGDTIVEKKLLFCVFPCVEKFGDEWGEHTETSNILLKARVCCGMG